MLPLEPYRLLVLRSCRNIALPVSPSPRGDMRLAEGQEHEHRRCDIHGKAVHGLCDHELQE